MFPFFLSCSYYSDSNLQYLGAPICEKQKQQTKQTKKPQKAKNQTNQTKIPPKHQKNAPQTNQPNTKKPEDNYFTF